MDKINFIFSEYVTILWNLIIGKNYQSALPYALVIVTFFTLFKFYKRGYSSAWLKQQFKGVSVTMILIFINSLGFAPFVYLVTDHVQAGYNLFGLPHVNPSIWNDVSLWILIPLIILIYDLANYWNHRLMHMDWLWPIHAIHHSETEMNGMTTYRVHFLESLFIALSYVLFLSWLGLPKEALGIGALFLTLHNVYTHMELDWGHGPFAYLLASPRFHRWHHADVPEAHGKNLANVFPFYDVMFGTYYVPGPCQERLGAHNVPENDWAKLVLYPFKAWYVRFSQALPQIRSFISTCFGA